MGTRWIPAVTMLLVLLLATGCVVEPVPPARAYAVPGHWAHGPWGPYWMEPHWRYVP
jgi:hypothetical protein